jgi:hypothetical protein
MRRTRHHVPERALARATRIWGDAALHARTALRTAGVHGDLRPLDEIASGRRGHCVPRGLATFALELAERGLPHQQIEETITVAVMQIVRSATAARDRQDQHGPHAA